MKLSDLIKIFRKNAIKLVKKEHLSDDYYAFEFSSIGTVQWLPGEFGMISIPDKAINGKKSRPLTIASIPEEGLINIATKIGTEPSGFKTALRNFKEGDIAYLRGPLGGAKLRDAKTPLVLIAGGIGITLIRALMKAIERDNARTIHVLYTSRDTYPFKDDLDSIAQKDANISVQYLKGRTELTAELEKSIAQFGSTAYYYLSGSRDMVTGIKKTLKSQKIPRKRIIADVFPGY